MISIAYLSSASFTYSDEDLATLLLNSRANNTRLGLTGVLLHRAGAFVQVLEGEEDVVHSRFAVIAADPRHHNVRKLVEEQVEERQFPSWTMGYTALTDAAVGDIPGYNGFFEAGETLDDGPETRTRARQLLEWFRGRPMLPIAVPVMASAPSA